MDAFYASVEQRDNPELRGKPVAVGGDPNRRGVVAAASYEARKFGVRSAIPMARAVRLCPNLIIVKPDFRKYKAASEAVFEIFRSVTPLVEPMSLDEAYLDVTENAWGEPLGRNVALRIKAAIREATNLTASAGVAPNKFLAKIASAWKKPDGLTVIAPERVERFLQKLPVDALWGVGPVTAARLRERGIERLIDVRTADDEVLRDAVGSWSDWLRQLANGVDDREVEPHHETEVVRQREHLLAGSDRHQRDPPGDRRHGARRRRVAGRARVAVPDRDDQGPLLGLHDDHAQPLADAGDAERRRHRPARGEAARADRRGHASGAPARRQRAQPRGSVGAVRRGGPGAAATVRPGQ